MKIYKRQSQKGSMKQYYLLYHNNKTKYILITVCNDSITFMKCKSITSFTPEPVLKKITKKQFCKETKEVFEFYSNQLPNIIYA